MSDDSPPVAEEARCRLRPRKVADSPERVLDLATIVRDTGVLLRLRPRWASGSGENMAFRRDDASDADIESSSAVMIWEVK